MARFNKRFEVRREMNDGGKIRPDDDFKQNGGKSSLEQQRATQEEAQQVGGFDDFDDINDDISENVFNNEELERQQNIEIKVDENENPVIPEGWTFLTHGSSLDRWDTSLLGNDFTVGNGVVNGREVKGRPLCCVERSDAKFSYERRGSTTAKAYGGKQQAFEIRVLFYKDPRLGDGKIVRDKLNPDELKDVSKYYMYQGGRHPAVPAGTKLVFVKNGDFDEITNTSGNNILWYIPEQYLKQYLDDMQQMQEKTPLEETDITQVQKEDGVEQKNNENENGIITNATVEQELSEFYTDDITNDYLESYLSERIYQIYGDRLGDAGIFNVRKFLDGKLDHFDGVESYRAIIEELESTLELAENMSREGIQEERQGEIEDDKHIQEEVTDTALTQDESKSTFDQALLSAGFETGTIAGLKKSIQTVSPETLIKMDSLLPRAKTKEQTLSIGGIEDGNEQYYR